MIQTFVDKYMENKDKLENIFSEKHPDSYQDILSAVITIIKDAIPYDGIDPERIHKIDDGDYHGTLVFVIAGTGYQPNDYWYVKIDYGSCSGCDTLQGIRCYDDGKPTNEQVADYMVLALHIVQGLKKMSDDIVE
jgi:hypothetical protein